MIIYLSGPISGLDPDEVRKHFFGVEIEIRTSGLFSNGDEIINPMNTPEQSSWADYMRYSIKKLMDCDYILMLNGWENSRGACLERSLAFDLGMFIEYERSLRENGLL